MKIGIDCITLTYPMAGIGRYTKNLVEALSKIDRENEYFLLYPGNLSQKPDVGENFHLAHAKSSKGILWHQSALPALVKSYSLDLLHCPGNFKIPYLKRCRQVLTIHDLIPLKFKIYFKNTLKTMAYLILHKLAVGSADKIITDSENTKKDVISILNVPDEKIEAIPLAVDKKFLDKKNINLEKVLKKYSLQEGYLLHLGGIGFNKNTARVIEAFKIIMEKTPDAPPLVIIGNKNWLARQIADSASHEKIIFTGYVPDKHMPSLYSAASVFIYPSLYEGFGFPVLEAMACGVPVVASSTSSFPEVMGDAGLLVDPENPADIAEKTLMLVAESDLIKKLQEKGFERVSKFSWENTAKKVLALYADTTAY